MKKKLISLLLALVVVIGLTAIGVAAEEATPATHSDHCICGGGRNGRGDHVCGEALTGWTEFSLDICEADSNSNRVILPAGNYYLSGDLTIGKELIIAPSTEVTFCLNGFELTGSRRVFRVNGVLNITDCYANGKITGNSGDAPVFYVYSGGHINLYGGILTAKSGVTRNYGGVGALATDAGNAPTSGSTSMTMYGGTLDASKLTITKRVSQKDRGNGGALILMGSATYPSTFIQYGGTIKGAKSVEGNGAAIYANKSDTVKILGLSNVNSGSAKGVGNGIAVADGANIVVGGAAKIGDLYMFAGQTFTTENLTGSVGLSTPVTNSAVLTTAATADEAAKFTSNVTGRSVIATEVEGAYQISLGGHNAHCVCGGNLTGTALEAHKENCTVAEDWIALTSENIEGYLTTSTRANSTFKMFANSGNYYLAEDIDLALGIEIVPTQNISLCLNGYQLTHSAKKGSVFRACGGTLNITDCTGEGAIQTVHTTTAPALYLLNSYSDATEGVTVNLFGGNLIATDSNWGNKAGVIQVGNSGNNPCVFNMYGGSVSGGKAFAGGNIFVERGTMNMYGGVVSGGNVRSNTTAENSQAVVKETANRGGNIFVNNGKFYMYGGVIENGTTDSTYYNKTYATEPNPAYGNDLYIHSGSSSVLKLDCAVETMDVAIEGTKTITLGSNFEANGTITCATVDGEGAIATGATADMLSAFAASDENYQTVFCNSRIWCCPAGDIRYACFCGGTYEGSNDISHTCSPVAWTAVNSEFLANSNTTTETVTGTDSEGNPTSEEVTTVIGWGSPVTNTNATLGGTYYEIPSGYYYLTEDITLEHGLRVTSGKDVRIDLNGHTITAPSDNARALFMQGNLRICDSSYDPTKENKAEQFQGAIVATRASNYSLAYVSGSGALRIYGGNYYSSADCSANTNAMIGATGEVYIFDGYFEAADMNGTGALVNLQVSGNNKGLLAIRKATLVGAKAKNGGIIGSTAEGTTINIYSGNLIGSEVSGYGGAVYTTKGSVTIKGGTISGGEATGEGGNIYAESLTMTGGTVTGGTSASYGGNIYITGESTISGGTVEKGISTSTSRSGGNICVTGGELTISGDAVISGGVANEGGNMSVRQKGTINITGGTIENGEAQKHGGNISVYANLNVSGGLIQNGKAVTRGGNISGFANTCNINITGGEIKNGIVVGDGETAAADLYGANITVLSDDDNVPIYLTITGGTIGGLGEGCVEGITSVHVQSSGMEIITTVGGTAVIDELRLGTARMLTIAEGGFSEGASIGITRFELTGVFAPNAAADYSAYFHGTKEGTSVEAVATETGYDMVLVSSIPYWAFDADNNPVGPAKTIADAMALEGATFVRLVSDYTTDEVVEGDLHLDLYGYDLTGLTVNGNLYAVDYKGHDYEEGVLGKLISFNGTVQNVYTSDREVHSGVRTYVALVNEDGSYSFHRVSVSITHVSLDPANDALGYKATISGDSQVLAAVTGLGFNMGVEGGVTKTYTLDGAPTDGVFTLRLKNIMAANGGEMTVIGQPIVIFGEDTVTGSNYSTSMKETIQSVNGMETLTDAQKTAVYGLYEKYSETMAAWLETNNIANWKPAEAETPAA